MDCTERIVSPYPCRHWRRLTGTVLLLHHVSSTLSCATIHSALGVMLDTHRTPYSSHPYSIPIANFLRMLFTVFHLIIFPQVLPGDFGEWHCRGAVRETQEEDQSGGGTAERACTRARDDGTCRGSRNTTNGRWRRVTIPSLTIIWQYSPHQMDFTRDRTHRLS